MAYCTKCGAQVRDDSFFCEHCGSRIPIEKLPKELVEEKIKFARQVTFRSPSKESSTTSAATRKTAGTMIKASPRTVIHSSRSDVETVPKASIVMRTKKSQKKIFFIIILIMIIGMAIISGIWFVSNTVYSEVATFSIVKPLDPDLEGIQVNISGSLVDVLVNVVSSDSLQGNMLEAHERVLGPSFFPPSDPPYQKLESRTITKGNRTWQVLEFRESEETPFRYGLEVLLNAELLHSFYIRTNAGSVKLNLENARIWGSFSIMTSAGSIMVTAVQSTFLTRSLEITTGAGSIELNLEKIILMTLSTARILSDAGSITLRQLDVNATTNATWTIETEAGSVDLYLMNNLNLSSSIMTVIQQFNVTTDVGSIDSIIDLNPIIGFRYFAKSSMGSVSVGERSGSEMKGSNPTFLSASLNYDLNLATDMGSISITGI